MWEPGATADWSHRATFYEWRSFHSGRVQDYMLLVGLGALFLFMSELSVWSLILFAWCVGHGQLSGYASVGKKLWGLWHHPITLALVGTASIAAVAQSNSSFAIVSYAVISLPLWYSWEEREFRQAIESASQTPKPAVSQ